MELEVNLNKVKDKLSYQRLKSCIYLLNDNDEFTLNED